MLTKSHMKWKNEVKSHMYEIVVLRAQWRERMKQKKWRGNIKVKQNKIKSGLLTLLILNC